MMFRWMKEKMHTKQHWMEWIMMVDGGTEGWLKMTAKWIYGWINDRMDGWMDSHDNLLSINK